MIGRLAALLLVALLVAGCGGPILANPPVTRPSPPPTQTPAPRPPDPQPIVLPADDAPHGRLTEWWYYTGHLETGDGRWFGFEYVVFRAERGAFPVSWASHLALTDEASGRFHYAQRSEIGPHVSTARPAAFDFRLSGGPEAWEMRGGAGDDRLRAAASAEETASVGFELDLTLATDAPAVLHDGDGWIDFGPAGSSYYYSRTRMGAVGSVVVDGTTLPVRGIAWFDHQWGDFIAVGGGGWDWFAVNLDDGTDLTLSLVREADGSYPLVYGTLVEADGSVRHLGRDAFDVATRGSWVSPRTGATYPAGWRISIPSEELVVELEPTVADQELDTRPTTGVVYWEGSQRVAAERGGQPLGGRAYVELTGYLPAGS